MGLDSVELLMEVEKEFGIEILDSEAEKIYTVQDFSNSVYEKTRIHPAKKCLTQIIFHRIRKSLSELGINKEKIKPNSKSKKYNKK